MQFNTRPNKAGLPPYSPTQVLWAYRQLLDSSKMPSSERILQTPRRAEGEPKRFADPLLEKIANWEKMGVRKLEKAVERRWPGAKIEMYNEWAFIRLPD